MNIFKSLVFLMFPLQIQEDYIKELYLNPSSTLFQLLSMSYIHLMYLIISMLPKVGVFSPSYTLNSFLFKLQIPLVDLNDIGKHQAKT
jgi:hypothetical protein